MDVPRLFLLNGGWNYGEHVFVKDRDPCSVFRDCVEDVGYVQRSIGPLEQV